MDFLKVMKEKAKQDIKTIVLPESYEERTLRAADAVLKEGLANIVLVGNKEKIQAVIPKLDLEKATFIDP